MAQFFIVEAGEIMVRCELHGVMIRKISLQDYLARSFTASGSTGYLRQQLEGAFSGAKIRHSQRNVRAHHAH